MLKTFLKNKKISMYKLSAESGVPYSTLNDLVNHKLPVENLKSGQLYSLSQSLGITMNELYKICMNTCLIHSDKFDSSAAVIVKHKTYYLSFNKNGKVYEEKILPVKHEATKYIEILAQWKLDEVLSHIAIEDAYETIHSKTTR